MSENTTSKSQAKRQARREEIRKSKREAKLNRIIGTLAAVVLTGLFAVIMVTFFYTAITETRSSDDYSALLNEDGTVRDISPLDYVEAIDYQDMTVPEADVTFTEEEVQAEIDSLLAGYETADTDSSLTAADGDTLNIDYVGTVDGAVFEGGDTEGNGTDLTLGSGSYVDDFEEQLIGAHPGDEVTVQVTFPEDYSTEDLQGKEAEFAVTVNSIYVTPEFTDEFVAENLSDYASTAEEYRAYLKETGEAENLAAAVETALSEAVVAAAVPTAYVKHLKQIIKYVEESSYESTNSLYYSLMGSYPYSSFKEYTGMSTAEFEDYLQEEAETQAALALTSQYIFADAGLAISEEEYEAKTEELGSDSAETYGKGYLMQILIHEKVVEYLCTVVTAV